MAPKAKDVELSIVPHAALKLTKKGSPVPVDAPAGIFLKSAMIDPVPFEGTKLPFVDGVIGPKAAGGIVMNVISMSNNINHIKKNVEALGAMCVKKGEPAAKVVSTTTADGLPCLEIVNAETGDLIATVKAASGVKVVNAAAWKNVSGNGAAGAPTVAKLMESTATWLNYVKCIQDVKPDVQLRLDPEQTALPMLQIDEAKGYSTEAPWVGINLRYRVGGCSIFDSLCGCCPGAGCCKMMLESQGPGFLCTMTCCYTTVKRKVKLDELLRRQKARSSKARTAAKKNAKAQLEEIKAQIKDTTAALGSASPEDKAFLEDQLVGWNAQVHGEESELVHVAQWGYGKGDETEWEEVCYKKDNWYFYRSTPEDNMFSKGEDMVVTLQKREQKKENKVHAKRAEAIEKGCEGLNKTVEAIRDGLAYTPMSIAQVLGGVKADLIEFASALAAGRPAPSLKLLTSLPLFMEGKCPITGIGLQNDDGSEFSLAEWAKAKMTEKMRTIYNMFFNFDHPSNWIKIFSGMAASLMNCFNFGVNIVKNVATLAKQCGDCSIFPRIAKEVAALVMSVDFSFFKIPFMIFRNMVKFAKFPSICKTFYGSVKMMMGLVGAFAHKDGFSKISDKASAASDSDMPPAFSKMDAGAKANAATKLDEKALEAAGAEQAAELEPDEPELSPEEQAKLDAALADAEKEEDGDAPEGNKMKR